MGYQAQSILSISSAIPVEPVLDSIWVPESGIKWFH